MAFPSEETFFLVEEPNADRRYLWRSMSPEFYQAIKARGGKVFKLIVLVPQTEETVSDKSLLATPKTKEWAPGDD